MQVVEVVGFQTPAHRCRPMRRHVLSTQHPEPRSSGAQAVYYRSNSLRIKVVLRKKITRPCIKRQRPHPLKSVMAVATDLKHSTCQPLAPKTRMLSEHPRSCRIQSSQGPFLLLRSHVSQLRLMPSWFRHEKASWKNQCHQHLLTTIATIAAACNSTLPHCITSRRGNELTPVGPRKDTGHPVSKDRTSTNGSRTIRTRHPSVTNGTGIYE